MGASISQWSSERSSFMVEKTEEGYIGRERPKQGNCF